MTTKIGASVFVDPSEIRRDRTASGGGCLIFGPYPTVKRLDLYFDATDAIDAVIAELTALRAEMTGDTDDTYRLTPKGEAVLDAESVIRVELKAHVFTLRDPGGVLCNCGQLREHSIHAAPAAAAATNPPHHAMLTGETSCEAEDDHYICTAQAGHDGPEHVAYGSQSEVCHRWPVDAVAALDGPGCDCMADAPAQDETPASVAS